MVWETREVREENWVRTYVAYLRPRYYTAQRQPGSLANALPDDDDRDAPRPRSMSTRHSIFLYNATATTTIDATAIDSCNSYRGFTLPRLPSMNQATYDRQTRPPMTATPNNHNLPRLRPHKVPIQQSRSSTLVNSCALVTIPTDFLTSQVCMAVSIDTRTALARFLVGLGRIHVTGFGRIHVAGLGTPRSS